MDTCFSFHGWFSLMKTRKPELETLGSLNFKSCKKTINSDCLFMSCLKFPFITLFQNKSGQKKYFTHLKIYSLKYIRYWLQLKISTDIEQQFNFQFYWFPGKKKARLRIRQCSHNSCRLPLLKYFLLPQQHNL